VLKQGQFAPYPVEEQVVAIFAGVRGYLDKIPAGEVVRFEAAFMDDIRASGSDILDAIRSDRDISEETDKNLAAFLDRFTKAFS
jgi:F-type H+-transporting ATPase subunit alpha